MDDLFVPQALAFFKIKTKEIEPNLGIHIDAETLTLTIFDKKGIIDTKPIELPTGKGIPETDLKAILGTISKEVGATEIIYEFFKCQYTQGGKYAIDIATEKYKSVANDIKQ